ncbi:hypothetical protein C8N24_0256 [Solirubrobacter pauli]|uniref:Uncharacterized protein n=1 Tax=Solirubrobacter pauli TaxID=166793 RepID=A0A660LBQ7_9ACTN|nr:hypothetical protein [Solirubrobacter pauli]RKQ90454.1 hypothetical protein C8N24_0256 [Solirubrobacter pauli]
MSPRAGGEADKIGNRYEGRWAVSWLLAVLAGRVRSIAIEERGRGGEGVEFTVIDNNGAEASHQVKRQRGNRNGWSLRELETEGVLAAAAAQVARGRQFWFVSLVPARDLDELSDQARRSDDLDALRSSISRELNAKFSLLVDIWGDAAQTFEILRGVYVEWPGERHLTATNAALAELLLGAPGAATAACLADLINDHLGETLDAEAIEEALGGYGLARRADTGPQSVNAVKGTLDAWTNSVERELLDPEIPREEAAEVADRLRSGHDKVLLIAGAAGHGKSAVLHQAVRDIAGGWPVLAMRLDDRGEFGSTQELGASLGLDGSPVPILAAAAGGGDCLLVVDQLDALSLASGRLPLRFNHIAKMIEEAAAFPAMRVLLACRQFDIDNDHRLKRLVDKDGPAQQMSIGPLDDAQVTAAVNTMGLDPTRLTSAQLDLLKAPLHLVLLDAIADQPAALAFVSAQGLMDAFYVRKRNISQARRDQPVRFDETVGLLVENMSSHQRLHVPEAVVESAGYMPDAKVLESEHVLVERPGAFTFFHEAFFDHAFARRWLAREQTLVTFLLEGEQELFRRAQVRAVLVYLRDKEPERFVSEVEGLLADHAIRFHIKEVVLALLRDLDEPTAAEWLMVQRVLDSGPAFSDRLVSALRKPAWFDRLDQEGVIAAWLSGDQEQFARAAEVMLSVTKERPDRLSELLDPLKGHDSFGGLMRFIGFRVDVHESRAFFELTLAAVRAGVFDDAAHDLFLGSHALGDEEPEWAVELLRAWLAERPGALDLDADGKVAALDGRDHGTQEIIAAAAAGASAAFAEFTVPYLVSVMALTSDGDRRPKRDRHFGYRTYNNRHHDVDDALLYAARDALRALIAGGQHESAGPLLDQLAADEHDASQWLLYEAMAADGEHYADWAGKLLCEGEHRLLSGYNCNSYWAARALIFAIGPFLSQERFDALEEALISFRPAFESLPFGHGSFTLLSALPEDRLSELARGRLRELRRVFGDEPNPPTGVIVGSVGSPIPAAAIEKMSDEQWLRAVAKHADESRDWSRFTGGATELARDLEQATVADPERFARLALRLDESSHPAYLDGVLRGLRQSEPIAPETVFEVMRHVASLNRRDNDRSLPDALRNYLDADVPTDIIELVIDVALLSPDPEDEAWQREAWAGKRFYNGDPFGNGMNTARGWAALTLGDVLIHDADGSRSALLAPHLAHMATDPSLAVRSCVAHTLAAALRHARAEVAEAFPTLVEAPDELLATRFVEELVIYLGFTDTALVEAMVERMLASNLDAVTQAGGRVAAYAGLELGLPGLLDEAVRSTLPEIRRGAATICAHRLSITAESDRAASALADLFDDADETVRSEAAQVASALREKPLGPHLELIERLIASAAFEPACTQLLITLDRATERVDELIVATTRRFLDCYRGQLSSIATHAAADAREIGTLLLRAYAQAQDAAARGEVLDLIDDLLIEAAYDFAKTVGEAER